MENTLEDKGFRTRMQRLETLLHEVEGFTEPGARAHTRAIVQAILDLHGAGLEKILVYIAATGETGRTLTEALARDDLVGSLLTLYGLHPLDLETRVRQALDKVRPYLHRHGGNVEFLGVTEGVARLRLKDRGHGSPSSAMPLKRAIEEAIYEAAPDVTAIEVEGVEEGPSSPSVTFVPVEQLLSKIGQGRPGRS